MYNNIKKFTVLGFAGFLIAASPIPELNKPEAEAEGDEPPSIVWEKLIPDKDSIDKVLTIEDNTLLPVSDIQTPKETVVASCTNKVVITAYSSSPDETWGNPFITASGNWVRDGIVAANFLPMGTKIKIPSIYNDKIFVVEDRMHPRKKWHVDIWFPSKQEALDFGVQYTTIEVFNKK